jgi:hypothetical protein
MKCREVQFDDDYDDDDFDDWTRENRFSTHVKRKEEKNFFLVRSF